MKRWAVVACTVALANCAEPQISVTDASPHEVGFLVRNPGLMRPGMFVTATFHGLKKQVRAVVPASAILHLHDREWVYMPAGGNNFRRVEVVGGNMAPPNLQEILSGISPGDRVVSNALVLQNTVEQ